MRSQKQGILNVTLLLKLTLSEPRETISTFIHALMRRPAARKLRSKTVVFKQAQSSEFSIEHYRPLASLMLQSAPDLDLALWPRDPLYSEWLGQVASLS
jgi:hypothetical protein